MVFKFVITFSCGASHQLFRNIRLPPYSTVLAKFFGASRPHFINRQLVSSVVSCTANHIAECQAAKMLFAHLRDVRIQNQSLAI